MSYQAQVIAGGKVVIPAELRREFGIKDGDSLVVERDGTRGLILKIYAQVVREVRAEFKRLAGSGHRDVVDELLDDRKQDARCERDAFERGRNDAA